MVNFEFKFKITVKITQVNYHGRKPIKKTFSKKNRECLKKKTDGRREIIA